MKKIIVCLIATILCSAAYSLSELGRPRDAKLKRVKTFHSRVYKNEYPLREIPAAPYSASLGSRKAPAQSRAFTDRVWFPGEWEEVKAIMVTPFYDYRVPGHENEDEWYAAPVVGGYADYYHMNETDEWLIEGFGPYEAKMDTGRCLASPQTATDSTATCPLA